MKPSRHSKAVQARDDGLRRVRKLTWRVGLLASVAAAVMGAKFAHLTAALPHLSVDGSSPASGGGATSGSSPVSGISSPSGISSGTGGGMTTSGGS